MKWLLWLIVGITVGVFALIIVIVLGIKKIDRIHNELEELTDLEEDDEL